MLFVFFILRTFNSCFDSFFKIGGSLGAGLRSVLFVLKPCNSGFNTFFSNS